MAKNSIASSEALQAGIIVTVSRLAKVSAQMSLVRPQRRLEDLLLKAEVGGGEYKCVVEQFFPSAPDTHPWVRIEKYPGSTTSYLLLLRHDKEVYKCELRVPPYRAGKEFLEAMTKAASEVCDKGWFPKKEVPAQPVPTVEPQSFKPITGWIGRDPRRLHDTAKVPPKPVTPPAVAAAAPKPVETPKPVITSSQTSTTTFAEDAARWLTAANTLITENDDRIAQLADELERKITALRSEYAEKANVLRRENSSLRQVKKQFAKGNETPTETEEMETHQPEVTEVRAKDNPVRLPTTNSSHPATPANLEWFLYTMRP